jgi:ABC-type branched-subunit amino acid transport system ATPase component
MNEALALDSMQTGYAGTQVIRDATLSVNKGEIFALLGKNGVGKTTILRTMIGLHPMWSGSITIMGRNVSRWRTDRIIGDFRVSYAPQEKAFFPDLSVDENLRLGSLRMNTQLYGRGRDSVIAYFPFIGDRLRQRAGSLSGGEQSMLKVARAILPQPEIVLLDEISEGLQPLAIERVRNCLVAEQQRGVTMLLVEQNIDFVWRLSQRYGLVGGGRVLGTGSLKDPDAHERVVKHLSI